MTVNIDGIDVNYIDFGAGEAILILEGWATNTGLYENLARHLSQRRRVIVPDLPGFGKTPPPERAWDCSDYADFAGKFLSKLGIDRAVLIGHSHGGRVIFKTVTGSPAFTVPKIVLIDSAGIVREKSAAERLSLRLYKMGRSVLSFAPVKALFPNALENLRRKRGSEDYRSAAPIMRETMVKVVNEDLRHLMPQITQPVLLIWGDKDTATPITDAYIMEKLIPGAGLVTVKGAGHYSYLEQPAFVYRVLDSFLEAGVN